MSQAHKSQKVETTVQEIETGDFTIPRWVICAPEAIRVVNWNVDRGTHLARVVDFLAGAKADLILLQETDINAKRTHHVNVAKEIAQKLQMNYVFGREFQELAQGSHASPAYHGQATLSRFPLSNSRIIRFRKQSQFWQPHWFLPEIEPFQERIGGRLALVTDAKIAGRTFVTYNLHLESKGDDALRQSQLAEVLDDVRSNNHDTPILLAGDFNLDASGPAVAAAMARSQFRDSFADRHSSTTPSSWFERGRMIDWIFVRGPVLTSQARVHQSISASDHYPLSIILTFT